MGHRPHSSGIHDGLSVLVTQGRAGGGDTDV